MAEIPDRLLAISEQLRDLDGAPPAKLIDELYEMSQELEYDTRHRWKQVADTEHERAEAMADRHMELSLALQRLSSGVWHFGGPHVPHHESGCTPECWTPTGRQGGVPMEMRIGATFTLVHLPLQLRPCAAAKEA